MADRQPSINLKELAELLRRPLDSPETLTREGWETHVKPITRPFLDQLRERLAQEIGGMWRLSQHRGAKRARQYWDATWSKFGPASLNITIGSSALRDEAQSCLFFGLYSWGKDKEMAEKRERFLEWGVLRRDDDVRLNRDPVFGGTGLLAGRSITPDELERMDADTLMDQIVADLRGWKARIETVPDIGEEPENSDTITCIQNYLEARGFHFPPDVITTYYLSLQTKPFVILSGISGTGKTKLAQLFAEFMDPAVHNDRAAFVPVRPDWTDHRGLLGFHHLLTGTYHATDFLRLLLRAHSDWEAGRRHPHFVILDEMNLARVEYYFADFLSVLESRRWAVARSDGGENQPAVDQDVFPLHDQPRCLLTAGNESLAEGFYVQGDQRTCRVCCDGCPLTPFVERAYHQRGEYDYAEAQADGFDPLYFTPPRMHIPLNVYFSGTVNVDESTFTFSPKVLDRANVIEFHAVDLSRYFASSPAPESVAPANGAVLRAFTDDYTYPFIAVGRTPETHTDPELAPYRIQLEVLVHLLRPFHLHFGYRVADEILAYLVNAQRLGDPGFSLNEAFDHAVLQKILPKFHGSRARLWEPMLRLLAFCTTVAEPDSDDADGLTGRITHHCETWAQHDAESIIREAEGKLRLPHSGRKLTRMLRDLEAEGFTSFT